jgi:4-phytase / acid phosphatase
VTILSLAIIPLSISFLAAQPVPQPFDDTQLKQVIIFGRHSVRAPVAPNPYLNQFSVQNFPDFHVAQGILTPNGEKLEILLGAYYRQWLTQEGLLTGNDTADAGFVYFHANAIQRTVDTAQHFWTGFLPAAPINVSHLTPTTASDPLFDSVGAGVAQFDTQMAIASVTGRLGGDPQSLASAFAPEFALTRSVLLGYPLSQTPAPPTPANVTDVTDFTANPIVVTPGSEGSLVSLGGLSTGGVAIDPFVMEYADGLPTGWGQLTLGGVSQIERLYNLVLDLEFRTPYLARVQSSNVASHIVRSMVQSATGNVMTGTLGTPSTKVVTLIASDVNVCGLAGLFHIDWLLPGFQSNFCGPGGALVFQLRQSQSTGEYIVRASYIAQTPDQLRNQTPLTLDAPPAIAPVFIPGCSAANATLDCPLGEFVRIANQLIDPHSTDLVN